MVISVHNAIYTILNTEMIQILKKNNLSSAILYWSREKHFYVVTCMTTKIYYVLCNKIACIHVKTIALWFIYIFIYG